MVDYRVVDDYKIDTYMDTKLQEELEKFAESGVLPMKVSKTGLDEEPLEEVIICDSVSGGADYSRNMPRRVTLVRRLADGTEYRANYEIKETRSEEDVLRERARNPIKLF